MASRSAEKQSDDAKRGKRGKGRRAASGSADDVPMPDEKDPQTRAYRDMTPADAVPDDELLTYASRSYAPLTGPPDAVLIDREDYDADGWDAGREDPR